MEVDCEMFNAFNTHLVGGGGAGNGDTKSPQKKAHFSSQRLMRHIV